MELASFLPLAALHHSTTVLEVLMDDQNRGCAGVTFQVCCKQIIYHTYLMIHDTHNYCAMRILVILIKFLLVIGLSMTVN